MTDRNSMLALTAKLYLQKKAFERKVRDAAFEAIRTIAAGCSDPAGRAQSVLELEAWLEELSPGAAATAPAGTSFRPKPSATAGLEAHGGGRPAVDRIAPASGSRTRASLIGPFDEDA